jgi:hypothetical protein
MPGETTTGSLTDSLPTMIADARIVREYEGVWMRTCDVRKLQEGTGLSWNEISLAQLTPQDITETTTNNNAQAIADTIFTITPSMTQILVKITDRTYRRIADVVESKMGSLAGNAMARKKDEDYLDLFSTFGTGASPLTANPLSFGHIAAAKNRISSNTTEPAESPVHSILHGFQIKDLQDEIVSGIGTYTVPAGMTEATYRQGWRGSVAGSEVFEDGNITVNATPDARGATHAREAVVAVMGMAIKTETRRDPSYGGGADEVFMTDEYAFGERSSGNWAFQHLSDATAPTS